MKKIMITRLVLILIILTSSLTIAQDKKKIPKQKLEQPTSKLPNRSPNQDISEKKNYTKEMVLVNGGTFVMGCTDEQSECEVDEKPMHAVTVGTFFMGATEVTQALWERVMGNNPSAFKGKNRPVEQITWYEAVLFCNKLSEMEGLQKVYSEIGPNIKYKFQANGYRLPTEAEWEFAARGGNKSKGFKYSGSNNLDGVGWCIDNSGSQTKEVAKKGPNELGLYDMSGNVWEWCWDWKDYYDSSNQIYPWGPITGSERISRGGSWIYFAKYCRISARSGNPPDFSYNNLGFRIVKNVK